MMSSLAHEIETAQKISLARGEAVIVVNSDRPGVYNTFSASRRNMLEERGYVCMYDPRTVDMDGCVVVVPDTEDDFVPVSAVYAAERAPYQTASSRTTPNSAYPYRTVGTWCIDDARLLYGRIIDQLRIVDARTLVLSEEDYTTVNFEGRGDDARRYADWIQSGLLPPPIRILQTDNGAWRVTDGHRRVAAAKLAESYQLPAWVSYRMDTGKRDVDGLPIYTALTFEGANRHIQPAALRK